jgi:hypothetical protein
VFRLYQVISLDARVILPSDVASDLIAFLNAMVDDGPDLAQIGVPGIKLTDALLGLRTVYGLADG